jgi:antitoxin FitA
MAQLLVRNLDDDVKQRLRRRAERHGRSMEEEARDILRDALKHEERSPEGLGTRLSRRFHGIGIKQDIPELREPVEATVFDE